MVVEIKYEDYIGLIKHEAYKYSRRYKISYEDAESEGNVVFCECRNKFDPSKGSFSTYFVRCMQKLNQKFHKERNYFDLCRYCVDDYESVFIETIKDEIIKLSNLMDIMKNKKPDCYQAIVFLLENPMPIDGAYKKYYTEFSLTKYFKSRGWREERIKKAIRYIRRIWKEYV